MGNINSASCMPACSEACAYVCTGGCLLSGTVTDAGAFLVSAASGTTASFVQLHL